MVFSEILEKIVASKVYGEDPSVITEIWHDKEKENVLCIRLGSICYDIVTLNPTAATPDEYVRIELSNARSKPSKISRMANRWIDGDAGEKVIELNWVKITEKEKTGITRGEKTANYTSPEGVGIEWEDDLILKVSEASGDVIHIKKPSEETCKQIVSLISKWARRCYPPAKKPTTSTGQDAGTAAATHQQGGSSTENQE